MAHLAIPGGGQRGSREAVADEDDRRAVDDGDVVAALHGLAAGEPAEAGDAAGRELRVGAHVDEIEALRSGAIEQRVEFGDADQADAVLYGAAARVGLGLGRAVGRDGGQRVAVGALFEFVAGEQPARCAVLQPDDLAVEPHPLQHAGTDDAARAAGTVDDHRRVGRRVGEGVGDPQRQLGAGHTAAAGDAESPVFLGRAGVEDDQLVAALDPLVQVVGGDFRYVVYDFDALAEVLGRYVDAPLGGQVEAGPAIHAAGEPGDIAIADRLGGICRAYDAARVVVAEDQRWYQGCGTA